MERKQLYWFLKHVSISLLLVNGYIRFSGSIYSSRTLSDSIAILGLIYIIIALFRFVRTLRFFDLPIFGVKKLWEIIRTRNYTKSDSKVGEYVDYLTNNKYVKPYIPILLVGITLLSCSFTLILFE